MRMKIDLGDYSTISDMQQSEWFQKMPDKKKHMCVIFFEFWRAFYPVISFVWKQSERS